jgi:hypothetical protein
MVAGLIALAAILFWYNSRGDETRNPANAARPAAVPATPTVAGRASATRTAATRRATRNGDQGTLRLQPIDATHGNVDPMLHLNLLVHLQSVEPAANGRNLFQMGAAPLTDASGRPLAHPIIPVKAPPAPVQPAAAALAADVNIPLKYYGFAKPVGKAGDNRGFFLDGDNILIASEGEILKQRYLVVELAATNARLEDTQLKKGKALPLVPEAREQFTPAAVQPEPIEQQ